MKGLMAMHRLMIALKELCKTGEVDVTYNEFIILLALYDKNNYVGSVHLETLFDKGLIVRTLSSLIEKELVIKLTGNRGNKYLLTERGMKSVSQLYIDRDHLREELLEGDELKRFEEAKEWIVETERRIRKHIFNNEG